MPPDIRGDSVADKSKSLKTREKASKGQRRKSVDPKRRRGAFPKVNRNALRFCLLDAFRTIKRRPKSVCRSKLRQLRPTLRVRTGIEQLGLGLHTKIAIVRIGGMGTGVWGSHEVLYPQSACLYPQLCQHTAPNVLSHVQDWGPYTPKLDLDRVWQRIGGLDYTPNPSLYLNWTKLGV